MAGKIKNRISYFVFKNEVEKGNIHLGYLFIGADNFWKQQALNLIKQKLIPPELTEFNFSIYHLVEKVDFRDILDFVRTAPFPPGEKKLIVIKEIEKISPSQLEELVNYACSPCPFSCLVLETMLEGWNAEKDKKIQKLEEYFLSVEFKIKESIEEKIKKLKNAVKDKDAAGMLSLILELEEEGEEPLKILRIIYNTYLYQQPEVLPLVIPLIYQAELEIKTGQKQPYLSLELLALKLCSD